MAALGYDMRRVLVAPQTRCPPDTRVGAPVPEAVPVISGLSCMADIVQAEFYRFSTVPKTAVKLDSSSFQRHINSRVSNLPSVLGDGILLSRGEAHRAAVHVVSESSPILRDVMVAIFNDTLMVDVHFSLHGQDSFFFVQPQLSKAEEDWVQLGRLGTMFNITKHVVESEGVGGPRGQVDIRMHSTSVVLNIRYGTSLQEEAPPTHAARPPTRRGRRLDPGVGARPQRSQGLQRLDQGRARRAYGHGNGGAVLRHGRARHREVPRTRRRPEQRGVPQGELEKTPGQDAPDPAQVGRLGSPPRIPISFREGIGLYFQFSSSAGLL
ncbi:hypothetical protein MTO96_013051 [Rhipicephalus appendiculatus]